MNCEKEKLKTLIAYHDENITRLLTSIISNKYNAKIYVAQHEGDFHRCTREHDFDIIFFDFEFKKNIFRIIEKFKMQKERTAVPIVLFTSYLTKSSYQKSIELDIFDILVKPFGLSHIYSIIDYILYQKGHEEELSSRRRYLRADKKISLKYSIAGAIKKDNKTSCHMTASENISVGGLRFSDNVKIFKNDEIEFDININNMYEKTTVSTVGIVRWLKRGEKNNTTAGIEFIDLENSDKLRLSHTLYAD